MALDSAIHYLDELKDKYMYEMDKAIEDWDYQDFSPDKRTPLLDNEIVGDAATDLAPEPNALQQIKDASQLDWTGLSRDDMLANQAFGRKSISSKSGESYEARVLAMATPTGGVQGIPDADAMQRFMQHAASMNPQSLAQAYCARLQQTTWQIRAKSLVLMELLLESPDLIGLYLPALRANAALCDVLDTLRTKDHSLIVRENARKALSLIRSNGADATLVAREPVVAKPHVRHSPVAKKKADATISPKPKSKSQLGVLTASASPVNNATPNGQAHHYHATSPKIAAAAFASWQRRSQKELLADAKPPSPGMTAKPMTPPPAPVLESTQTSSMTLQKSGSSRSAFTFVGQPQQRVSVTTSFR